MAINDTREFDPSKRIKAAFGEENAANLEADAVNRLAQAMASNCMRRSENEIEEDENMDVMDAIRRNIIHTNPKKPTVAESEDTSTFTTDIDKMKYTMDRMKTVFTAQHSKGAQALRALTGITPSDSSAERKSEIKRFVAKNITSFVVTDVTETILRGTTMPNKLAGTGITSGINFVTQAIICGNNAKLENIFNPKVLTAEQAKEVEKTIRSEKIKYAAQHTLATVVAPALTKIGIDKALGDKVRSNKAIDIGTSFGVLSTIGQVGLSLTRKALQKKAIEKAKNEEPNFTVMAKLSINNSINDSIDDALIGRIGGTAVGLTAWNFSEQPLIEEMPLSVMDSFKKKDVVDKILSGEPVIEEKPKAEEPKTSAKATSTKKTA